MNMLKYNVITCISDFQAMHHSSGLLDNIRITDESLVPKCVLRCEICNKVVPSKSHLARHMLSHTKEKPFMCSFCNQSFSRKDNLMHHIRMQTCQRRLANVNQESLPKQL